MDKQSSYFASSHLLRAYDLAGLARKSKLHVRNLENEVALGELKKDCFLEVGFVFRGTVQ